MKQYYNEQPGRKQAPNWAEGTAPRNLLNRHVPSLLLIHLPEEDEWQIATLAETDAIADPNSYLGRLLRSHCALMSLPYASDN
ncbi:MAG: hypothetical protein ABI670_14985 [Chloroflexota bacterium]